MKLLVYTFRTFPHSHKLEDIFGTVFVFDKIKDGLIKFENLILKNQPNLILGVAKSNYKFSVFEPKAINQFHKKGRVSKNEKFEYPLFVPHINNSVFKVSNKPTDSYCNYTIFKIAEFLESESLNIVKFSFVHILPKDIEALTSLNLT